MQKIDLLVKIANLNNANHVKQHHIITDSIAKSTRKIKTLSNNFFNFRLE